MVTNDDARAGVVAPGGQRRGGGGFGGWVS